MKFKLTTILFLIFFLNATSYLLLSQPDKYSIHKKLKDKFKSIQTISAKFSIGDNSSEMMNIKAAKNNKYILELGERIIYCDGKNVWNYSINDNSVVISSYDPSDAGISLEQVFFDIIESFQPSELKLESSSFKNSDYILILVNPEKRLSTAIIKSITLYLNKKNFDIYIIKVKISDGSELSWQIHELIINPKLNQTIFEFKPQKDTEVIDLRLTH
jgi:outer membrane lipoprotein-sorting protein